MTLNSAFTKELEVVENLIKKDLNKENIISGLYEYIFKSSGKKNAC